MVDVFLLTTGRYSYAPLLFLTTRVCCHWPIKQVNLRPINFGCSKARNCAWFKTYGCGQNKTNNVPFLSSIIEQYGDKVDLRGTAISVDRGMFSLNLAAHIGRYKGHPIGAVCLIHCYTLFVTGMYPFDQSLHAFFHYTWWPTWSWLQVNTYFQTRKPVNTLHEHNQRIQTVLVALEKKIARTAPIKAALRVGLGLG